METNQKIPRAILIWEGWKFITSFSKLQVWGSCNKRILWSPETETITLTYSHKVKVKPKHKRVGEICPLCERPYNEKRLGTRHHLYPKLWYGDSVRVEACSECHTYEFHRLYPMINIWTKSTCLKNWVNFCRRKGKDAFKLYPQLLKEV